MCPLSPARVFPQWMMVCGVTVSLIFFSSQVPAFESFTTTVSCYDGVNLSTGATEVDPTVLTLVIGSAQEVEQIAAPDIDPLFHFSPSVHVSFGLTANPAQPVMLQPQADVAFAIVEQTDPASLTDTQLATLGYAAQPMAVAPHQFVVAKLGDGIYRILGQIAPNPDATVQFTVWTPEIGNVPTVTPTPPVNEPTVTPTTPVSVPEPGTLALFAVGIVGLWRIFKRITKQKQGGNTMKRGKIGIFLLFICGLWIQTALAIELRVVKIGTGDGSVEGEHLWCGDRCKATYPEKTVVQLKAEPFPDSRFIGWIVNDKPHQGTLTIEQDTIVKAIFELKEGVETDVYWYNGDTKERATLALDEIAVFIAPWNKWDVQSAEDYQREKEEILRRFHPEAKITVQYEDQIFMLKSPEPIKKDELSPLIYSLTELKTVQQVGPVLYIDPNFPETRLILTDQIAVKFPEKYSEEDIHNFEGEYGLTRIEAISYIKNGFNYRLSTPLEALQVANQLYESGKVDFAYPEMVQNYRLDSRPNDPLFPEQWHLENTGQHQGTAGEDVDIVDVWEMTTWNADAHRAEYLRGAGVMIAVVDDGVEIRHEDLASNIQENLGYDFVGKDTDPSPPPSSIFGPPGIPPRFPIAPSQESKSSHGTAVAGVAAGVGFNGIGISGAAPEARIVGYRVGMQNAGDGIEAIPNL